MVNKFQYTSYTVNILELTIAAGGQEEIKPPFPTTGSKKGTTTASKQADNGAWK